MRPAGQYRQLEVPPPGIDGSVGGDQTCHVEYCFTITGTCTQWVNSLQTHYMLPSTDGAYSVQSAYRVVCEAHDYPSPMSTPYAMTLILPNTPTVTLNSPTGILDPTGETLVQSQNINGTVGQWVTYTASSSAGAQLNITANGSCGSTCDPLAGGPVSSPPYMWLWTGSGGAAPPDDTYLTITATDDAGNTNTTDPVSTSAFTLFNPSTAFSLTCDGVSGNCISLADQADNDIPGDSPSGSIDQCNPPHAPLLFSGYGDPSMRAEQLAADTYGTDLWMLYSYPSYDWSVPSPSCSNTTTSEIHLAYSQADAGANGGARWNAWCSGAGCSSPPITPIFPSEPYCSGSITPINGMKYNCSNTCNVGQPTWATCFSSHEVANFWPFVNTAATPYTETWFAVHLMYWVQQGHGIDTTAIGTGCLMVSEAGSPGGLGWTLGSGPSSCSGAFPSGSQALPFSTLTSAASTVTPGLSCNSWGEPAIMVAAAPPGDTGNAIYLAASCIDVYGASVGYYIFVSQAFTTPPVNTAWIWSNYAGPFTWGNIPLTTITQNPEQTINSLTEFDWAVRGDGSMVAVVTPMYVYRFQPNTSTENFQYGCLAINFNLTTPTALFGSLVATLNDTDQGSPYTELYGSNG